MLRLSKIKLYHPLVPHSAKINYTPILDKIYVPSYCPSKPTLLANIPYPLVKLSYISHPLVKVFPLPVLK